MVNEVLNQLQALIKPLVPTAPLIEVAERPGETPQWVPGQRLPATVLAGLPNGRFQVQVEDSILDMNLPRNTQPGDSLGLVFVAREPRLTFLLSPPAQQAPIGSGNVQVTLSDTARLIGNLLEQPPQAGATGQANAAAPAAPVLPGPPADPKEFAQALHKTLSHSGLFYEAHQAEWVAGKRPLAELRQEPQAQLPPVPEKTSEASAAAAAPDASRVASLTKDGMQAEALPLVQRQLDTLDTRQVVWQGQIWPGQDMQWQIEERQAGGGHGEEPESHWQTTLRLKMPSLGPLSATLSLHGKEVRIAFQAEAGDTASALTGQAQELADRLNQAGLRLGALTVKRG